ncbi:MAG TPA: hypothetical protein ENN17_01260 [bacterium]|nr:hypothetical protein [bacterium]
MFPKILKFIGMVIGGVVLGVLIAFVFGWIVMLLWNRLMPPIFGLPAISFWQAWGLVILSHLLFKAGGHHPHREVAKCTPGWKHPFRDKLEGHLFADARGAEKESGA